MPSDSTGNRSICRRAGCSQSTLRQLGHVVEVRSQVDRQPWQKVWLQGVVKVFVTMS